MLAEDENKARGHDTKSHRVFVCRAWNHDSGRKDKAQILDAYHDMLHAMLEGRTAELDELLDDQYSLTHITGDRQSKWDWLAAIGSGRIRYHGVQEKSVAIDVAGSKAVLTGSVVLSGTVYGEAGTWDLQLIADYSRINRKWIAKRTVATST